MTVDSEAIFAVAAHSRSDARALEALEGAMAAAWLDERDAGLLHLARGVGRPLWLGQGQDGIFFASTKLALEVLEHYCAISLRKRQVREGTLFALCGGRIAAQARFKSQRYVEAEPLPAVRAPGERESCLSRLAALAAA
jgi:glutamine phosphoribosylpyrophosphate amidotransferase